MYTACATERAAEQQRRFGECLLQQMLHKSYGEITVTDLCEMAGLSRKTFYRLFGCKEDVLWALIDGILFRYPGYGDGHGENAGIYMKMHQFFAFWLEERALLDALARNRQSSLLIERTMDYVIQNDQETLRWMGAEDRGCRDEVVLHFVSGLIALVVYWHGTGFARSVEEMSRLGAELLTNPPLRGDVPE